jgi:dipeptidase D
MAVGRVLAVAHERTPLRLVRLDGGVSRNAIPREARAVVAVAAGAEEDFRVAAKAALEAVRERHAGTDDGLALSVEPIASEPAADETMTSRALDLLAAAPSGVVAMSAAVPGAVETSTSLNVAGTDGGVLTLASMTRSASPAALDEVVSRFEALARLASAEIEVVRSYPPWRPDPSSRLLATARATYARLFDVEPALDVVHGGLECAVIGAKLPGVDMVSIGPEIVGPHAPGERLSISGTARFYRLLGALLDDLSS